MLEGARSRYQSTKYPSGKCKSECKNSCLSCFACGTWYHSEMCFGIVTNILSSLTKQSSLIWLCEKCQESAKNKLKETDQNFEIHSKVHKLRKKLWRIVLQYKVCQKKVKEIEIKFKILQNNFEAKLDKLIEKQEKPALAKPTYHTPIFRKIMKEILEQQEKEKIENEKREQNIVLFRVPESTQDRRRIDKRVTSSFSPIFV